MDNRLPPGQSATDKWPVLTYGETPRIDISQWRFRLFGLVDEPGSQKVLTWRSEERRVGKECRL